MFKKVILLIFIPLVLLICSGCATNPVTGKGQLMLISPVQEIEIGRKYAPEIEKQMGGRINNLILQNYVNSVGQRIVVISHNPDLEYHFTAVEDKSLNALALPGGYIFITRGLLENLRSEAQLASILAHEVVHIVARHTAAAMSVQIGVDILLSAVTSEETSRSVLTAANLGRQIMSLKYSREDEKEADLVGLDYMVSAGYRPSAMVETMEIFENEQRARPVEFFSTHPAPENRQTYLSRAIEAVSYNLARLRTGESDYAKNVLEQLRN